MFSVYDSKKVKVYIGGEQIVGFSPDSKVTITPASDGTDRQVGTDGDVAFSVSNDNTFDIKINLMQSSKSNDKLSAFYNAFTKNGTTKRIMIKDLSGSTVFSAPQCAPKNYAEAGFQKTAQSREWTIVTSQAENVVIGGSDNNSQKASDLLGNTFSNASTILY